MPVHAVMTSQLIAARARALVDFLANQFAVIGSLLLSSRIASVIQFEKARAPHRTNLESFKHTRQLVAEYH